MYLILQYFFEGEVFLIRIDGSDPSKNEVYSSLPLGWTRDILLI